LFQAPLTMFLAALSQAKSLVCYGNNNNKGYESRVFGSQNIRSFKNFEKPAAFGLMDVCNLFGVAKAEELAEGM